MRPPEQPFTAFNPRPEGPLFSPSVVLLELFRASKQASDLYASEDWQAVCANLSEDTRAEVLKGLRATHSAFHSCCAGERYPQ
jgi:hypothetical protein